MSVRLSRAALHNLDSRVGRPRYDVAACRAGILHIGVGNFHRAHQAVYLDTLLNSGRDLEWALVGSGVRDADRAMRHDLAAQDFLTTVVEQRADRSNARVVGSMIDFIEPGDCGAMLARLADPAIRIVSLTITEGGYCIDPATQRFDPSHPEIIADAAAIDQPRGAFGLILGGLARRRAAGTAPYTVMSCDNLPGNGDVTRDAVTGLAALVDPGLAHWVGDNVAFPNSMVDRITPATTQRERELLERSFAIADARPVFCEEFSQWVIEDRFPAGRPALEDVGVEFVGDVAPYELMKIRILNGGHAAIAYPAALMDIHVVHDAMQSPLVAGFLAKLLDDEVIAVVPPVPNTDLYAYKATIEQRFANPKIGDTIRRLCLDGSNRQPKFILPSVRDRLHRGMPVDGLALVGALWCRYCEGHTDSGEVIEPNDPQWTRLNERARMSRHDPRAWLAMRDIFGDIADDERYVAAFSKALAKVHRAGARAALAGYVGSSNGAR